MSADTAAPRGPLDPLSNPTCSLGEPLAGAACPLDVNGDGADITVGVSASHRSLDALNVGLMLLDGPSICGKTTLIRLLASDSVDATLLDGDSAVPGTGLAGFRADTGSGHFDCGWVELTRGSHTVGGFGYQNTLNAADWIETGPTVAEPASLLLVATGATGIAALRRRRRAATAQPLR